MPVPHGVARLNRTATNHAMRPLARHMAGFGVVIHHGRSTGRTYETPVNVFGTERGVLVALTYGEHTDWVRNVLAEGGCAIVMGGTERTFEARGVVGWEVASDVIPAPVAAMLRLIRVDRFLTLDDRAPT